MEYEDLLIFIRIREWLAITLLFVTFILTAVLGAELGITISLSISVLWIIKKTALPHIAIMGQVRSFP